MMLEALIRRSQIADELVIANSTEQAKALIDTHDFEFAFIDYEMPSEDGPAVIAYLREKQPRARIALQTSADSEEYEHNAREAGAEEFICTSYPTDEVEARVMGVLEKWKRA